MTEWSGSGIRNRCIKIHGFGFGSGLQKIMNRDPDPVNIRPDPNPAYHWRQIGRWNILGFQFALLTTSLLNFMHSEGEILGRNKGGRPLFVAHFGCYWGVICLFNFFWIWYKVFVIWWVEVAPTQGRIQEWGAEIAPQPTQAPHLAPPHTSAQPAFNLPLDSNIIQFRFFIASLIVTLVTCKRYFKEVRQD